MLGRLSLAAVLVVCALAVPTVAQISGPGIDWSGSGGNETGNFFFTCTPLSVAIVPGETVTITVWGDTLAPYWLLASPSATSCVPVGAVANSLVVDPPSISIAASGILDLTTPCLSCPPGLTQLTATIPVSLPAGTTISIQGLTFALGIPSFTSAITATV